MDKPRKKIMLDNPKANSIARDMIMQALDCLEDDKQKLSEINEQMIGEIDSLRAENLTLRSEVDCFRTDKRDILDMMKAVKNTNKTLSNKIEEDSKKYNEHVQSLMERQAGIIEENTRFARMAEELRQQLAKREQELYEADQVCEKLKKRIEMQSRKNFEDRNVEFLHELQCTKEDAKKLSQKNEQLKQSQTKLNTRVSYLLGKLNEHAAELKNEKRRHNLLTAEFNSLMQENSKLKKQNKLNMGNIPSRAGSPAAGHRDKNTSNAINVMEASNDYSFMMNTDTYPGRNISPTMTTDPNTPIQSTTASVATNRKLKRSSSYECLKTKPTIKQMTSRKVNKTKSFRDIPTTLG